MTKHSSISSKPEIKVRGRNRVARTLTKEELNQIATAAHDSGKDMEMALHELLAMGFRAPEVAGARHGVGNTVILAAPKSFPRRGSLYPAQSVVLRNVEFSNAIPGELLFPCRDGCTPFDIVRIARIFHQWVIRAGLTNEGITLFSFRRSVSFHKLTNAANSLPG